VLESTVCSRVQYAVASRLFNAIGMSLSSNKHRSHHTLSSTLQMATRRKKSTDNDRGGDQVQYAVAPCVSAVAPLLYPIGSAHWVYTGPHPV
jgi:hypothetical protein